MINKGENKVVIVEREQLCNMHVDGENLDLCEEFKYMERWWVREEEDSSEREKNWCIFERLAC